MNEQKNKQQPEQGKQKDQGGKEQKKNPQQKEGSMADTHRKQPMGSDIENPDKENDPDKKVNIDDDPEQTKRKVPNMGK